MTDFLPLEYWLYLLVSLHVSEVFVENWVFKKCNAITPGIRVFPLPGFVVGFCLVIFCRVCILGHVCLRKSLLIWLGGQLINGQKFL